MAQLKCNDNVNDIVISGISGRFPSSRNVEEFLNNLNNKVNMVNDDETRFKHTNPLIPRASGKIPNLEKFDGSFFGFSEDKNDILDVQSRIVLEESVKAIMDAGVNPESMRCSKTGVYVGCSSIEVASFAFFAKPKNPLCFMGVSKSLLAGRISYCLGLEGPSLIIDTACSSSIFAIDSAMKDLNEGIIDAAIVCGSNMTLSPSMSLQFALLGVLSPDGLCRPFDADANGYTRSEAVVAIFLQRRKNAKRVYSTLVASKSNCDGFKVEGITFPSSLVQEKLLRDLYSGANICMDDLGYIEAHATATSIGDPEECRAIDNAICSQRTEPLYIGSVKSNCGHSEPAAGLCSVVKVLMALNSGTIPPNINFSKIKDSIEGLKTGRLIVVANPTKLLKPYAGVNSFGFGGANAHLLMKQHEHTITLKSYQSELPRLVVWSGRTERAISAFFDILEKTPFNEEYIALAHSSQAGGIKVMRFRGYAILNTYSKSGNPIALNKSIKMVKTIKQPIVWVFGGVGAEWTGLGKSLMRLPVFKQSIQRCHNTLKPSGLDLVKIIMSDDPKIFNNVIHTFVGNAALQIALVDLLKDLEVKPDFVVGYGIGELGCAYAENCLTAEQMILASYYRGKVDMESNKTTESLVPKLLNYLQHIIPKAQLRSRKWISACFPKSQWFSETNKYSSAEYHTSAMLQNITYLEESLSILLKNSITIQIAPHSLLHKTLTKKMPNAVHIELIKEEDKDSFVSFLNNIGSIYANGVEIAVDKLYPEIKFPVSRGTKNLSSNVLLDHTRDNFVYKYVDVGGTCGKTSFTIKLEDDFLYLRGHEIDGRVLIPATFYLECVWKSLVKMFNGNFEEQSVEFENVKFERATTLPDNTTIELTVLLHKSNGAFEVSEAGSLVVSGYVRTIDNQEQPKPMSPDKYDDNFTSLEKKHFYKELKLRGYHYSHEFQSVDSAFVDGALGKVKWIDNWVAFMDCMLQLSIIQYDSRTLMLPTKIRFLRIFPKYHKNTNRFESLVHVYSNKLHNRLCAGGIEIVALEASTVHRRRAPGDPVLEHYTYVPNFPAPKLQLNDVARCCIQLALENSPRSKLELVQLDTKNNNYDFLLSLLKSISELPLTTYNCSILHNKQMEVGGVSELTNFTNIYPQDEINIIGSYIVITDSVAIKNRNERTAAIVNDMDPNGFIILHENEDQFNFTKLPCLENYACIGIFPSNQGTIIMYKNVHNLIDLQQSKILRISAADTSFKWLDELQKLIGCQSDLIVLSEDDKFSGVLGLVNCLTKEPETKNIRVVFVSADDKVAFKINSPEVVKHLQLGLAVNVYKNGQWGTYRHLSLVTETQLKSHKNHVYGNIKQIGDLSSLTWMEGPIVEKNQRVHVMFSSLNFKDVMQASGRLPIAEVGASRLNQTCIFGFEYSGVSTKDGKRVMGMTYQGAVSSHIEKITDLQWQVPDDWSLQDAATVPVVYLTVYYAFFYTADIRKGKTILIHAGSGGIGLAAIRTAQTYGLEVYTTVSTPDKKAFLLKTFPTLKESNIGNSRDISFEDLIMTRTKGKGVDFVLNSLSEEKLKASVRCMAQSGHFMEIGKFDMAKDNDINLSPFAKALTFHTILADNLLIAERSFVERIKKHIYDDIKKGIIQPLPSTVFGAHEIEKAFRFLMSGKHIGKVLLQVRDNENSKATLPISVVPQTYFQPDLVYIVPGGLGGFGLELVDWMIIRGASKFVLSSSRGVSNDYQKFRISIWRKYNCEVSINTSNISTEKGCLDLLKDAMKLGAIGGIFNLAVKLKDSIFSNQTKDLFLQSFGPKALATKYLDQLSRKLCPELKHFVVFSSVSCGRGNAGQTNYGMANSIMERIIENRVANGLPGKAIQWGAVGEVGLVAEMAAGKIDLEIGGTLQQRISSCLEVLDELLNCSYFVVASMVVAEKKAQSLGQSPMEFVLNAMSIRDVKSVSMNSTLTELGMDSLLSVEIKQTFERDYDIVLNTADLRSLTFAQLAEISANVAESTSNGIQQQHLSTAINPDETKIMIENLYKFYGEIPENVNPANVVKMNDVSEGEIIIFLPGIMGTIDDHWMKIGANMNAPAFMIQLYTMTSFSKISDYTDYIGKHIIELLSTRNSKEMRVVGYSMGAVLLHFVIEELEKKGYRGSAILIDGSPFYIQNSLISLNITNNIEIDKVLISVLLNMIVPELKLSNIMRDLRHHYTREEWFKYADYTLRKFVKYQPEVSLEMIESIFNKIKILQNPITFENIGIISTEYLLVKPSNKLIDTLDECYGLSPFTKNIVRTETLEGNHNSILHNPKLYDIINAFFFK